MAEKKEKRNRPFEGVIPEEALGHARAAGKEMRESLTALLPPKFVERRRKARKEMLLAFRSILDNAIERLD